MDTVRDVVAQLEAEWEQQLGRDEFARLRDLLAELNAVAAGSGRP